MTIILLLCQVSDEKKIASSGRSVIKYKITSDT